MSVAEIADNKWELESIKPPIKTPTAIGQIALIGGLGLFFLYIVIMSVVAIVTPKKEGGLADQYKNLNAEQPAAAAEE
ncbi:MAG: hypothetical protein D6705_00830 [Deltaproteobacteria bacterium]|nr:MAG: hypothetical protein D6705_00830 [Deltaproteobacteria bacterium]